MYIKLTILAIFSWWIQNNNKDVHYFIDKYCFVCLYVSILWRWAGVQKDDIHQLQKVQKYRTQFIQQHTTEKVSCMTIPFVHGECFVYIIQYCSLILFCNGTLCRHSYKMALFIFSLVEEASGLINMDNLIMKTSNMKKLFLQSDGCQSDPASK